MAPQSSESQFSFLISCIRYSNNGKVDFDEVAKECGIVSKGAAAKRYERMMKAHGIYQNNQPIRDTTIASTPRKRAERSDTTSTPTSKKRKSNKVSDSNNTDTGDDDEGLQKKPKVKAEKIKDEVTEATVKEEATTIEEEGQPMSTDNHSLGYQLDGVDDAAFFDDFIQPGTFDQPTYLCPPVYESPYAQQEDVNGGLNGASIGGVEEANDFQDTIFIAD